MTIVDHQRILKELGSSRFSLEREKETQAEIASALAMNSLAFEREVDLGDRNIIDFVIGDGVGVEVKLGGSKREIFGQCERYCRKGKLKALILVSNVAIGLPEEIEGVPCYLVSLGRAWL